MGCAQTMAVWRSSAERIFRVIRPDPRGYPLVLREYLRMLPTALPDAGRMLETQYMTKPPMDRSSVLGFTPFPRTVQSRVWTSSSPG